MSPGVVTALAMVAFAANSVLNRAAVGAGEIDALAFATVRAASGALFLAALVALQRDGFGPWTTRRGIGIATLSVYLIGFSLAYVQIDAGLGALLLFGAVQVTMFAGGLVGGERPHGLRWAGVGLALAGLAWLVWPGTAAAAPMGATVAMVAAGLGWGLYSLAGRGSTTPVSDTAANFIGAAPICALVVLAFSGVSPLTSATPAGYGLAVLSGAVTSGLGYVLWYRVLPQIGASAAGLVQLSVPVLAALGGVALLAEPVTLRLVGASALVLGGIAVGLIWGARR